jgi:hypothetical protein
MARRSKFGDKHGIKKNSPKEISISATGHNNNPDNHQSGDEGSHVRKDLIGSEDRLHRTHERNYWRRQIKVAKILNVLTFLAALVGVIGLFFIWKNLEETHLATVYANRAWIKTDVPKGLDVRNDNSGEVSTIVTFQNVGRTPATDVVVSAEGYVMLPIVEPVGSHSGGVLDHQPFRENDICERMPNEGNAGTVWPDSSSVNFASGANTTPSYADIMRQPTFYVYQGCIKYNTLGETHRTKFCYFYDRGVSPDDAAGTRWGVCPGTDRQNPD